MAAHRQTRWSGILALAALVAVTSWWLQQMQGGDRAARLEFPREPDSYMEGIIRTTMDERGRLATRLQADRMFHYPEGDTSEYLRPRMRFYDYREEGGPWRVSAQHAWVGPKADLVLLRGDVRIWRDDQQGMRVVEVLTTELQVITPDRYAQTEQPATIITPTTVSTGTGMRAQLGSNRLELLKDVRTRYAPVPAP